MRTVRHGGIKPPHPPPFHSPPFGVKPFSGRITIHAWMAGKVGKANRGRGIGGEAASWGLVQGRWLGLLRPSNGRGEKEAKERRIETRREGEGGKGFFLPFFSAFS